MAKYHLLILLVKDGLANDLYTVFAISFGGELQCFSNSLGSFEQALPGGVFAQKTEYFLDVGGNLFGGLRRINLFFRITHTAKILKNICT